MKAFIFLIIDLPGEDIPVTFQVYAKSKLSARESLSFLTKTQPAAINFIKEKQAVNPYPFTWHTN